MSLPKFRKLLPLLLLPVVAGCADERASLYIDSRDHALTLIRVQRYFWDKTAEFTIVPTRMPDCMRRHSLGSAPKDLPVEIYAPGNGAWIVKFGDKLFVTETRNCEGFARLDAAPGGGMGPLVGTFRTRNGELAAVPAPRSEGPAAPAAPATTVPAAQ